MQSIEFNHLWRRAAENRGRGKPLTFFFAEDRCERLCGLERHVNNKMCKLVFPRKFIAIEDALTQIWSLVCDAYNPGYVPRGIERHELVSALFEPRRLRNWKTTLAPNYAGRKTRRLIRYARDRALVEMPWRSPRQRAR